VNTNTGKARTAEARAARTSMFLMREILLVLILNSYFQILNS